MADLTRTQVRQLRMTAGLVKAELFDARRWARRLAHDFEQGVDDNAYEIVKGFLEAHDKLEVAHSYFEEAVGKLDLLNDQMAAAETREEEDASKNSREDITGGMGTGTGGSLHPGEPGGSSDLRGEGEQSQQPAEPGNG